MSASARMMGARGYSNKSAPVIYRMARRDPSPVVYFVSVNCMNALPCLTALRWDTLFDGNPRELSNSRELMRIYLDRKD
ncbi:hypothetical protein QO004_002932 [Rhizobium mesoamericanum]|nr:hypothetical protein [Rhizobium mesoamericanum]